MEYPGPSLDDAARVFTQAAYGKAITPPRRLISGSRDQRAYDTVTFFAIP
jgi:hypothetical protein